MTMRPISCRGCGRDVLVEKFSPAHTSIQWPFDARECPLIAAQTDTAQTESARFAEHTRGCAQLRASIDAAIREHELVETHIDLPVGAQIPRLH